MHLIQDIFTQYGSDYLKKYGKKMPSLHKKALHAIMNCRTKSLGGEMYYCKNCNDYHYSYHSCGNRHCVICQNNDATEWIERNKKMMLPLTYFLATFTIPEELRNLCRSMQKLFYTILFKASSDALKLLAKDKKYLGAGIGMIGILHTWSRALVYHPHIHYLIPGGGIGDDGETACTEPVECIRFSDNDFLMHVKPLTIIFRAKFRDNLKKEAPEIFNKIPANVWKRDWVVHIKAAGDGEQAMEYMGRYLFRVAISNNRIIKLKNGKVTFRYTDSKTGKTKIVTLDALEFIRRFLQHVLPHNFMKVRYYGYLAAAAKKKLASLRKLLFVDSLPEKNEQQIPKPLLCPTCGSPLQWVETLPKGLSRAESKGFSKLTTMWKDHVP
jgi:hypothetical protein